MKPCYLFNYFRKSPTAYHANSLFDCVVFSILLVFSCATSFANPSYQIFIIPTNEPAEAVAINDAGQVTGFVERDSNQLAFIYDLEEGLQFLETLGGETSRPSAINNSGQIVGSSQLEDSVTHAFLWSSESGITDLTPSHSGISKATDISNTGIVVGTATPESAFEWSQNSGLQIVKDEREGYGISYLGVADNGVKLKISSGPDSSVGTSYFLSSIPGEDDLFLGQLAIGTGQIKVATINHNGVATGWKQSRGGSELTFVADATTLEITNVLESDPILEPHTIVPVDINDKQWLVSNSQLFIPGGESSVHISSELIAESSDHLDVVATLRVSGLNNHGDIVGHGFLPDGRKVGLILINENREPQPSQRVAQYGVDFSNPIASGWRYQWNANTQIGQVDGYIDMQWDRWKYDSDGLPGLPDASSLAYGHFSATGGHPGLGQSQGESHDRYVIAGFEVSKTGEYIISNSQLVHTGCAYGNGGVVKVYIDDKLLNSYSFVSIGETQFDGNLGLLNAGSIIYVAVGPNDDDDCDGFEWDYAIELLGGDAENQPPVLNNPGNQSSQIDETINLAIDATDPEGDVLSFEAIGLPSGLSINSASGAISGIPSSIGTHNVLVTVTDEQGEFATVGFDWVIYEANTVVARYSTDFGKQPARGWRYQWNPKGSIGHMIEYVDMLWDRWKYDSDGLPGLPDSSGLAYGYFSAFGGHPGRGSNQSEKYDRYVIAGFMIDVTAEYRISDSQIIHAGCDHSDGQVVDVYVDDNLIGNFNLSGTEGSEATFDANVGLVNAGSIIYVAVGPKGFDSCDGFDWDYAIERINLPSP